MSDDKINPSHYKFAGEYEPIKVIERWGLGFKAGSAIKYIARAGRKAGESAVEDLQKARWYLQRLHYAALAWEKSPPARNPEEVEAAEEQHEHPPLQGRATYLDVTGALRAWGIDDGRLRSVVMFIAMGGWSAAYEHLDEFLGGH
jgi:hypothetical protein